MVGRMRRRVDEDTAGTATPIAGAHTGTGIENTILTAPHPPVLAPAKNAADATGGTDIVTDTIDATATTAAAAVVAAAASHCQAAKVATAVVRAPGVVHPHLAATVDVSSGVADRVAVDAVAAEVVTAAVAVAVSVAVAVAMAMAAAVAYVVVEMLHRVDLQRTPSLPTYSGRRMQLWWLPVLRSARLHTRHP